MRFIPNYVYLTFLCLILFSLTQIFSCGEELSNKKSATIMATNSSNLAPTVTADMTTGKAPILIKLAGSNSTDDIAITEYLWISKESRQNATLPNPNHTFKKPRTNRAESTGTYTQGLCTAESINIIARAAITNVPDGSYYEKTNGSSNNDGLFQSKTEHAFRNKSWIIPVDHYGV